MRHAVECYPKRDRNAAGILVLTIRAEIDIDRELRGLRGLASARPFPNFAWKRPCGAKCRFAGRGCLRAGLRADRRGARAGGVSPFNARASAALRRRGGSPAPPPSSLSARSRSHRPASRRVSRITAFLGAAPAGASLPGRSAPAAPRASCIASRRSERARWAVPSAG